MKRIMLIVPLTVLSAVMSVVQAVTPPTPTSSYIGADSTTDAFYTDARWSGGVAPASAGGSSIDYLLASGRYIRTPNAGFSQTFSGNSLTMGTNAAHGDIVFQCVAGEEMVTFANAGLFLKRGWMTTWNDSNPKPNLAGTI